MWNISNFLTAIQASKYLIMMSTASNFLKIMTTEVFDNYIDSWYFLKMTTTDIQYSTTMFNKMMLIASNFLMTIK